MSYITSSDLDAYLPPGFRTQALDDDADGVADADLLDKVIAAAQDEVDGYLGQRYTTPFTGTIPSLVKLASRLFVLETLYLRRGLAGDNNPFAAQADDMREKLTRIGGGKEPLTPDHEREQASVSIIDEDSKTYDSEGRLAL